MTLVQRRTTRTSAEALASIDTTSLRARVVAHVRECGAVGATCDEIEQHLGMLHQTASARCREALDRGQLVRTDRRRPTSSGRNAYVLVSPEHS